MFEFLRSLIGYPYKSRSERKLLRQGQAALLRTLLGELPDPWEEVEAFIRDNWRAWRGHGSWSLCMDHPLSPDRDDDDANALDDEDIDIPADERAEEVFSRGPVDAGKEQQRVAEAIAYYKDNDRSALNRAKHQARMEMLQRAEPSEMRDLFWNICFGEPPPSIQIALQLAIDFLDRGQKERALEILETAGEMAKRLFGKNSIHSFHVKVAQAVIAFFCGDEASVSRSWTYVTAADDISLELLHARQNETEEDLLRLARSQSVLSGMLAWIGVEATRRKQIATKDVLVRFWRRKNVVLDEMRWRHPDRHPTEQRAKRMALAMRNEIRQGRLDPSASNIFSKAPDPNRRKYEELFLGRGGISWESFTKAIAGECPNIGVEYVRTRDVRFVGCEGVKSHQKDRYLAFVVDPQSDPRIVELGEAEQIDGLVRDFLDAIKATDGIRRTLIFGDKASVDDEAFRDAGVVLRKAIVDPLGLGELGHLPSMISIAVDSELALMPFEALPTDDGKFLDDHVTLHYATSLWELTRYRRSAGRAPRAFVLGDPNYAADIVEERTISDECVRAVELLRQKQVVWNELPGTKEECREIGQLLGVVPFTGEKASVDQFISGSDASVIHIASHGYVLPSSIDAKASESDVFVRAGLVFSGADHRTNEALSAVTGILCAADVAKLKLLHTELVVLSACETGFGEATIGEGVMGFRRAFWVAGVQTMVTSLWKVPDHETAELMKQFYANVAKGVSCARALQVARKHLRTAYPPSAWAPFILQGNPAKLPEATLKMIRSRASTMK